MQSVVVSGPADQAEALATALRDLGFDTFGLDLPPQLGTGATGSRPARPVDCYVQLAGDEAEGGSPTRTLLRRVEAVAVVSPLLARDATVLMVGGDGDPRRRFALRLMAEAVLEDAAGERRVVVLEASEVPEWIAVERSFSDIVESLRTSPS
jgi:hypothetical protein